MLNNYILIIKITLNYNCSLLILLNLKDLLWSNNILLIIEKDRSTFTELLGACLKLIISLIYIFAESMSSNIFKM